jgi:hypothetical protein
MRSVPDLSE